LQDPCRLKICDVLAEPAQRTLQRNTSLDLGTFSKHDNLQAGKRYEFEVVTNKKNFLLDALFGEIPASAMFNAQAKKAVW
jgi:hypothetical protein